MYEQAHRVLGHDGSQTHEGAHHDLAHACHAQQATSRGGGAATTHLTTPASPTPTGMSSKRRSASRSLVLALMSDSCRFVRSTRTPPAAQHRQTWSWGMQHALGSEAEGRAPAAWRDMTRRGMPRHGGTTIGHAPPHPLTVDVKAHAPRGHHAIGVHVEGRHVADGKPVAAGDVRHADRGTHNACGMGGHGHGVESVQASTWLPCKCTP